MGGVGGDGGTVARVAVQRQVFLSGRLGHLPGCASRVLCPASYVGCSGQG